MTSNHFPFQHMIASRGVFGSKIPTSLVLRAPYVRWERQVLSDRWKWSLSSEWVRSTNATKELDASAE